MHVDHIGQVIRVGDWCAMTQNNECYVGKIISISRNGAPTIARDAVEQFVHTDPTYRALDKGYHKTWQQRRTLIKSTFPGHVGHVRKLGYCRAKKFVKINPTDKMQIEYDWKAKAPATP